VDMWRYVADLLQGCGTLVVDLLMSVTFSFLDVAD